MKKRLAALCAVLLLLSELSGCSRGAEGSDRKESALEASRIPYYVNDAGTSGCVLGDTFYSDHGSEQIRYYTPDGVRDGLCRDPLCTHRSDPENSETCPDSLLWPSFASDGTRLYLSADVVLGARRSARRICALSADGGEMKVLCEYEPTANNCRDLAVAGRYLYFEEGRYNDTYDPGAGFTDVGDQVGIIVRIPVEGGRPEQVTDECGEIGAHFAADDSTLWRTFLRAGELERIDLKTRESERIPLPDEFVNAFPYLIDGTLWLTAFVPCSAEVRREDGSTIARDGEKWFLYRLLPDGGWDCLAQSETRFVCAGDEFWTVREDAPEYLGTKAYPTGRGSEKSETPVFDSHARRIEIVSTGTGEKSERLPGEGVGESESLFHLYAVGETVVYANLIDWQKAFTEGIPGGLACLDRETLSVIWRQEP